MPLFISGPPLPASLAKFNFSFIFGAQQPMATNSVSPSVGTKSTTQTLPVLKISEKAFNQSSKEEELKRHTALLRTTDELPTATERNNSRLEEVRNAPLFTRGLKFAIETQAVDVGQRGIVNIDVFPQYGLIGHRKPPAAGSPSEKMFDANRDIIYANMNAPWSAFICGSQGAGKSHTFSCLLENALLSPNTGGVLPDPLTGIVFHYDKFTSHSSTQLCEAAFLCSVGIPVQILVSPSNIHAMEKIYTNLPGLAEGAPRPQVRALRLHEDHLNVGNMKTLMAVDTNDANPLLYMAVLDKILRDMARERGGRPGFNYAEFKERLYGTGFTQHQLGPLALRLQLLEEFLDQSKTATDYKGIFDYGKGSLTIVDLSCPFVDENAACALFSICLSLFLERRNAGGRIIALDEAHKFLTQSGEAKSFTEQLVSVIRQQRHLASRVVIATQEPTLSPQLLELCNVIFVHRFRSPRWLDALKKHIAGAASTNKCVDGSLEEMFQTIVGLRTGEALVFSPDSLLDVRSASIGIWDPEVKVDPLLDRFVKVLIRNRISADGGKSIMASDKVQLPTLDSASTDYSGSDSSSTATEDELAVAATRRIAPLSPRPRSKPASIPLSSLALRTQQPSPAPSWKPLLPAAPQEQRPARKAGLTKIDVLNELRRQTRKTLDGRPKDLDFGRVRARVEKELPIPESYWSSKGLNTVAKTTIKETALAWFKSRKEPMPAYAHGW